MGSIEKVSLFRRLAFCSCAQVLDRLEHVHEQGHIHMDVKPDNFLVGLGDQHETIFIIDFGKRYSGQSHGHWSSNGTPTNAQEWTFDFADPFRGKPSFYLTLPLPHPLYPLRPLSQNRFDEEVQG